METCFIVNPIAGKGRALKKMDRIAADFKKLGLPMAKFVTSRPGEAVELAAKAADEGFELVVSVGGDGTIREVAEGLINKDAVMGMVPGGTGNDYCRLFGIDRRKTDAADMLLNGRIMDIDCMQVDEFTGLNISTVGFDSEVVRNAKRYSWAMGFSYLLSVLYTVRHYQSPVLKVSIDGAYPAEGTRFLVAAGNGSYYGGGIKIIPASIPNDGIMNYCIIDRTVLPEDYFKLLPKVVKGTHKSSDRIHFGELRSITIESDEPFTLNVDGTLYYNRRKVHMQILPAALKIIVPQGAKF